MPPKTYADKISSWIIVGLIFFLPIFLIPSPYVSFQFAKVAFVYLGVIAALVAWVIGRLKDGKIYLARPAEFLILAGVLALYALSSLASPARAMSFIGQGFEISTFSFVSAMAILLFLIANLFTDRKQAFYAYFAFLCSFIVVCLFQFSRLLFGSDFLSFGFLNDATSNLVGSWSDLGIYFGAVALFSFITLELLNLPRWAKIICGCVLAISLFILSVIGFTSVWYALGAFSLVFFVYNFSFNRSTISEESPVRSADGRHIVPVISLLVLIVSFVFILSRGNVYSTISSDMGMPFFNRFAVSSIEVSPTWFGTWTIAKNAMAKNPFLGVGPNRFVSAWLMSKTPDVNNGPFWSTDFNYGVGFVPTLLATVGVVGFLAWLAFMALFLYVGFKSLFARRTEAFSDYLSISSFIIALYFWLFAIFHVPSAELIVCMFAFTGIFFASAASSGSLLPPRTYDIVKNPRTSFVSVLALIAALLGIMIFGYTITKKFAAHIYFNMALAEANNNGNIAAAENDINRALKFSQDDIYYRTLAEINIAKISNLITSASSLDSIRAQFQSDFLIAQDSSQKALQFDGTKYENWMTDGHLYETILPLGAPKAYEQALADYQKAEALNPENPTIPLTVARLEIANKNIPQAKNEIINALKLKGNYTDAMYLLAQIQVNEGDLKSAIASVEAASLTAPGDATLFFQLGYLRYNNKDYVGAISAFEQAISITPDYANAKYFMGLAQSRLGQAADALKTFQEIKVTNPDNKDLDKIISNLQAGRDPLANLQAPPTTKVDKNSKPPVTEKDSTSKVQPDTAGR